MRILLCTDLDRTLLPNGRQRESDNARGIFASFVSRPEVTLAYVTGRHRELVEDAIRQYRLPAPNWVIADVGTSIYRVEDRGWHHWRAWERDIAQDWIGLTQRDLRSMFSDLPMLRLQEEAKQNRFKLSYYLPEHADTQTLLREMSGRLGSKHLKAVLVESVDEESRIGLLDVLPARATKLHAVEFLMTHRGFDYSNTVFAGDSGNDMQVFASRINSIVVANASREVVEQAKNLAHQNGTCGSLYLALGGFMGMNGNYSAGILEGIAHFLPMARPWLNHDAV